MTDTDDDHNPADGADHLANDQLQRERLRDLNADGTTRALSRSIAKLQNERGSLLTRRAEFEGQLMLNSARVSEIDNQLAVLQGELTASVRAQVIAELADSHWTRFMFKMKDDYDISETMVRRFSRDAYDAIASFLTYHGTDSREKRREQHEWAADVVPMWREARRRNGRRVSTTEAEIVPVYPEEYENWTLRDRSLPHAYWSVALPDGLPYHFEYRRARTAKEMSIARMYLPDAPDWDAMLDRDPAFGKPCHGKPFEAISHAEAVESIRDYLTGKSHTGRAWKPLQDGTFRTWLFLLYARRLDPDTIEEYFGLSYFDGLCMPCPATGDDVIRKLVCTYE